MGDAIEDMKAVREHEKSERRRSWEDREQGIAVLRERGFNVEAKGTEQQHYRIRLSPGAGFVDFWPSTWKWHHKRKRDRRPRHQGRGLKSMLGYLMGIGEPKIPQG